MADNMIRCALEFQDDTSSWTEEERQAITSHIEEGYRQAERGELISSEQARSEIQEMKVQWRSRTNRS